MSSSLESTCDISLGSELLSLEKMMWNEGCIWGQLRTGILSPREGDSDHPAVEKLVQSGK